MTFNENHLISFPKERNQADTLYPIHYPLHILKSHCILQVSSAFQKFLLHHFTFYKRPTLVLVFANQKDSKDDFKFYKKWWKVKIVFSLFCNKPLVRQVCTMTSKSGTAELFPWELYYLSYQATHRFKLSEHLCFVSIYFVHLLAKCVLRYQKCPREVGYFLDLGTLKKKFQIN